MVRVLLMLLAFTSAANAAGLAPDPAVVREAVVQVYGARTAGAKGIFGVHTWVAVKPTDAQAASLNRLQEATDKAVGILQAACPDETPLTPPGRLEMMEKRLQAMIDAADTVGPALTEFYGSLSSEQKARFNRIGSQIAASSNE